MSEETIRGSFAEAEELDRAERIRVEVARLSKLDRAGYLAERKITAKALDIPVSKLDKLVEQARPTRQAQQPARKEPRNGRLAAKVWDTPIAGSGITH